MDAISNAAFLAQQGNVAIGAGRSAPSFEHAKTPEQVRKVAEDFEAFFLGQMLQPLFSGIDVEPPFGGGHAEEIWQSMMVDEYGKAMAKSGGIGIADAVMRQMIIMQEGQ